jgi:hypothetical protein
VLVAKRVFVALEALEEQALAARALDCGAEPHRWVRVQVAVAGLGGDTEQQIGNGAERRALARCVLAVNQVQTARAAAG